MTDFEDPRIPLAHTFVIVRAYNEGKVIGPVVSELCSIFENVIVVNDGSADDTAAVLRGLPVTVVTHLVNLGPGAAMQTGLRYALESGAEYILTFDADGQHRVQDALALLAELQSGTCDVVYGSRFLGTAAVNIPAARKLLLKAAAWISNLLTKTTLTDAHNGLRAFTRKAAAHLEISQTGMAYASEITTQLTHQGMIIHEVPVQIVYTAYSLAKGQSSLNSINIIIDLIVGRFLK
jgi:polyprenyl-phospho-N-acetylgalactosaminyl synthase